MKAPIISTHKNYADDTSYDDDMTTRYWPNNNPLWNLDELVEPICKKQYTYILFPELHT